MRDCTVTVWLFIFLLEFWGYWCLQFEGKLEMGELEKKMEQLGTFLSVYVLCSIKRVDLYSPSTFGNSETFVYE
jgi:hypothetical protein